MYIKVIRQVHKTNFDMKIPFSHVAVVRMEDSTAMIPLDGITRKNEENL